MNGIRAARSLVLIPGAVLMMAAAAIAVAGPPKADDSAGSSDAARAAYSSAAAFQNREAWDLAAEEWQSLLDAHPQDPLTGKARYYLGICLLKTGKSPQAAAAFRQVIASQADAETVALARFELGRTAYQTARATPTPEAFAAAAASLREFLDTSAGSPQAAEALYFLGESLWQAGRRDEAIAAWQQFVQDHPEAPRLPDVLYALGVGQAETGNKAEAAATLERFAKAFPQHGLATDVALWRADLASAAGKPADAETILASVVDGKGPRSVDALERLAASRWNRKAWAAAAEDYRRLAEKLPDPPRAARALLSAGIAFAESGNTAAARASLGKAAAISAPEAGEAAHRLARLEIDARQPARAVEIADQATATLSAGGKPSANARRMLALLALDRADALWDMAAAVKPDAAAESKIEAARGYARIVQEYPEETVAKTAASMAALAMLEAGKPEEAVKQADAFLKRFGAAEATSSATADVKAIRAEALLAKGEAAASAAAYQALIATAAGPPPVPAERLARWRLRQGVALVAAKDWQQAHGVLAATEGLGDDAAAEAAFLDATALLELKNPAEAARVLSAYGSRWPKSPRRNDALLLLVRAQREAGDKAGALATAERLVREFPAGKNAGTAWYRLGQARQDAGRPDEAIEAFTKANSLEPQGPRAAWSLLASGWCHESKGRLDAAAKTWSQLVASYPDSTAAVPALLARADVRQRQGDFASGLADARDVLARKAAGKPLDATAVPEAMLISGLCLAGLKQHAEAAEMFRGLLEAHPDFAAADRALFEMGASLALADRGPEAGKVFAAFVKRFPQSAYVAEAWFELGEQAWNAGRYEEAASAYRATIEQADAKGPGGRANPVLAEQARHKLAWTFVSRGDHAAAVQAFADQLARHPAGTLAADAEAMRGESLFRSGKSAEAAVAFTAALADPKRLPSAELRGLASVRAAEAAAAAERWEESLAIAERFIAAEPASPQAAQARYAAAWAKQNLGRLDAAIADYRGLAEAARTELAARARLMEGEVLFEQGKHKDAIKALFKVAYGFGEKAAPQAFHPWQAQATFEAARCFEVLEQPDKARGLYQELIARYPDSAQAPAATKRLESLGRPKG